MDAVHEPGVLNVCMVGRIEPNKNQLEALKAIAQLKEQGVPPIHLHFIGRIKDEAYHVQMQQFIAQHQLTDVVSFLGVRFDVPELLKKMDVGLMLSTSEAFGRVTVEFQMQNVAVVASDAGANAELIESGRTGFLYPLGQPESLAACLKTLVCNRETLLCVAQNGKRNAMENFTSARNSEKIYKIYQTYKSKV